MQATGIRQTNEWPVTLRDGARALLRPVMAEDRCRLETGLTQLSLTSRYYRFFAPVRCLSDELLRYFTEVDQQNHVAWVALNPGAPRQPGLGIGRFVRCPDAPQAAEFALTVIDTWQRKGLGTYLLAILCRQAQAHGVRVFHGVVLPENQVVSEWLVRLGARRHYANGVCDVELPVPESVTRLPSNPTAQRFGCLVEQLRTQDAACGHPFLRGG